MAAPVPVVILTGFLGSGKTTLLNQILDQPHNQRIAVLVNEFGALGIDGALTRPGSRMIELPNGCVCCTINGDLLQAALDVLESGDIDLLVVETTGIADPYPVALSFRQPELRYRTRVDSIVCLVDSEQMDAGRLTNDTAVNQVAYSDLIVLNKIDLVDEARLHELEFRLRLVKPGARVIRARQARVDLALLLGQHLGLPGEHRTVHHHYQSCSQQGPAPLDPRRLQAFLAGLPGDVLRAKGLVELQGAPAIVFHVCGTRLTVEPAPTGTRGHRAVFIGEQLDEPQLTRGWIACHAAPDGKTAAVDGRNGPGTDLPRLPTSARLSRTTH